PERYPLAFLGGGAWTRRRITSSNSAASTEVSGGTALARSAGVSFANWSFAGLRFLVGTVASLHDRRRSGETCPRGRRAKSCRARDRPDSGAIGHGQWNSPISSNSLGRSPLNGCSSLAVVS